MRLGGPVFGEVSDPTQWAAAVRKHGYTAAYCPVSVQATADVIRAYANAAEASGIVIAEVGAWSNPISPDDETRHAAISHCQAHLALADEIGARCCVNISGSRGDQWDGPAAENLTPETFDLIVEVVREIIDAVRPRRTYYTLETMPWAYPDSPESYRRLVEAIDRARFAVHFDPVNLIHSPRRFFDNGAFLRECFAQLGPFIKSCHAKDIQLSGRLTTHLDEVRPGVGRLDYPVFLREICKLDPEPPLMLEHLADEQDYDLAAAHIRAVAQQQGIAL